MTPRKAFFFASPVLATLVAMACGGTQTASSSGAPGDDAGTTAPDASADAGSTPESDAGALDAAPDAPAEAGANCTYVNFSGSSSSGGMCETTEEYSCKGAKVEITCACPQATCTCGGKTMNFDCKNSCSGTTKEIRDNCGVDTEPPTGGGGGSTSSSSGGP